MGAVRRRHHGLGHRRDASQARAQKPMEARLSHRTAPGARHDASQGLAASPRSRRRRRGWIRSANAVCTTTARDTQTARASNSGLTLSISTLGMTLQRRRKCLHPNGIISAISNGASSGANSLAANLGAGAVHALAYGAAAGTVAVVKGGLNAVKHLTTGRNPHFEPDPEEEEERSPDPPKSSLWGGGGIQNLKPKPKSSSWFGGSSGSQDKPSPHPYPAPWSPEAISAYNGGVHEVSSGEEAPAPGPVHPGPAPKRRGNRLAQRDVRYSQETLSRPEYQNLPRKRNGRN